MVSFVFQTTVCYLNKPQLHVLVRRTFINKLCLLGPIGRTVRLSATKYIIHKSQGEIKKKKKQTRVLLRPERSRETNKSIIEIRTFCFYRARSPFSCQSCRVCALARVCGRYVDDHPRRCCRPSAATALHAIIILLFLAPAGPATRTKTI